MPGSRRFWSVPLGLALLGTAGATAHASAQQPFAIATSVRNDTSPAALVLRAPVLREDTARRAVSPPRLHPQRVGRAPVLRDPVVQSAPGPRSLLTVVRDFAGLGEGFAGPKDTLHVVSAPPDPSGAAGETQYVQATNVFFAVFDKATGEAVYGPVPTRSLWAGFGTACEAENDGDPVVKYDQLARRWIISQFQVSQGFSQCVAVSETSDATGRYFRYEFESPSMNDYPKISVWPDAYYVSYNMFRGPPDGARVCAWERDKMLAGQPAREICAQLRSTQYSLLPADLDGDRLPPAGSANYMLSLGANSRSLNFWKFRVNWQNPQASTFGRGNNFAPDATIAVQPFNDACAGGQACIPQPGTNQVLESVGERLMYRLAYRPFADHESLVVTHSVHSPNAPAALRWYELRNPGGTPVVFQQGTYSPDTLSRWMGSIAMDRSGNILIGYSVSGTGTNPSLRVSGRTDRDPLGVLATETVLIDGGGPQINGLARWGDYSHMSVDPVDDCTFWYTAQYGAERGSFNWKTRISAVRFHGCPDSTAVPAQRPAAPAPAAAEGSGMASAAGPVVWGGEGILLTVNPEVIQVRLRCAHGSIGGRLPGSGEFALAGSYAEERAGALRRDDPGITRRASYVGRIRDSRMTMRIDVAGLPDPVGPFTLWRGLTPRLVRCL